MMYFVQECIRIFNKYHPLEIDENIPFEKKLEIMNEWYKVNLDTFIKFEIDEETINCAAYNDKQIYFRSGSKQFLIKNQCKFPNIFICSNFTW